MSQQIFPEIESNRSNTYGKSEIQQTNWFKKHKVQLFFGLLFLICVIVFPLSIYYFIISGKHEYYYIKNMNVSLNNELQQSFEIKAFFNGSDPFFDYLYLNISDGNNNDLLCQNIFRKMKINESLSTFYKCGTEQDFMELNTSNINEKTTFFRIYSNDEVPFSNFSEVNQKRILARGSNSKSKPDEQSSDTSNKSGGSDSSGSNSNSGCSTISGYGYYLFDSCTKEVIQSLESSQYEAKEKSQCSCGCDHLEGYGSYTYKKC